MIMAEDLQQWQPGTCRGRRTRRLTVGTIGPVTILGLCLSASQELPLVEAMTSPRLAVHILRSLTFPERLAWLPWIAGCVLVAAHRWPAETA